MALRVNGEIVSNEWYDAYHAPRFDETLALVRRLGGGRVVEVGGYPWAMTSRLLAEPVVDLRATVSAEEVSSWPDALPVTRREYEIQAGETSLGRFSNYSANIERTLFTIDEQVDLVLACEIIEHLTRAPHTMMLNINSWLKPGGLVVVTTPNGAQMENPFRNKSKAELYRPSIYSRHNYVFSMNGLVDLIQACGFEIVEAEFSSPYSRTGLSGLYPAISRAGPRYLKDKFAQNLSVVARKVEERTTASHMPICYSSEPGWERIDGVQDFGHVSSVNPQ